MASTRVSRAASIGFPAAGQGAVIMTNANGSKPLIEALIDLLRAEYRWPR